MPSESQPAAPDDAIQVRRTRSCVDEIRIPGGRIKRCADREQNGVPLAPSLIKQVDEMAATLGIKPLTGRG